MIQYCTVTKLSEDKRVIVGNGEIQLETKGCNSFSLLESDHGYRAFVQRLPQALSYVSELESGAHAILFYDNLAAAAEYICAFIEEGIRRQQTTVFLGLSKERYETLFDQVGIDTAMLETCGYLRHISNQDSCSKEQVQILKKRHMNLETLLRNDLESNCQGARFVLLNEYPLSDNTFRDLMKFERWLNTLGPSTVLCCYDARQVLDEAYYNLFPELLKTHGHCLFQGIAMPTHTITGDKSPALPETRNIQATEVITQLEQ